MITIYTWSDGTELYHHGILGQKWGVRRFQNKDGSLTAAGKRRRSESVSISTSKTAEEKGLSNKQKKVILVSAGVVAAGAAAYLYATNKSVVDTAVKSAMASIGKKSLSESKKAVEAGKKAVKDFGKGVVQGAQNAPMKVGKAVGEGIVLGLTLKALKEIMPEGEAEKVIRQYNAFNKKNKINLNAFNQKSKDDEDEED